MNKFGLAFSESSNYEKIPIELISSNIRVDWNKRAVCVLDVLPVAGQDPWVSTNIEHAVLPPTVLTGSASRLVDNEHLFELFLLGLDVLASRSGETKSFHKILTEHAKVFAKTAEFAWVMGFYDLRDVPKSVWEQLRNDLAAGGWCRALRICDRTASYVSQLEWDRDLFLDRNKTKGKIRLKLDFLSKIGTNIAVTELAIVRNMLDQASNDVKKWRSGDSSIYTIPEDKKCSSVRISKFLGSIDLLAQVAPDKAIKNLPGGSNYDFALKKGRAPQRTRNLDPNTWGDVLMHAYNWILDVGPEAYKFVAELIDEQLNLVSSGGLVGRDQKQVTKIRAKLLASIPGREALESKIGLRITTYKRTDSPPGETSVLNLLLHLYSACFIVLASMNARRKDEVIGRSIGIHVHSLKKVDDEFDLYECEFYIEKKINGYKSHYVNEISRSAIKLLRGFSDIAWCLSDGATKCTAGRDRKLFVIPRLLVDGQRAVQWFKFNNGTPKNSISRFIQSASPDLKDVPLLTPHMFRRAYGLLYHFRYENSQLIALAQKYGHIDVEQTLHYITDGAETEHGKTAVAKWANGSSGLNTEKYRREEIQEIVREVGSEKLREYIGEVVESSRRFSGGFSKLVARFNRKMGASISYEVLDNSKKLEIIVKTFTDRGHEPTPYPWGTCMAGKARKHSACSVGPGDVSRENASPHTCARCPYSDTTPEHLINLVDDEKRLVKLCNGGDSLHKRNVLVELSRLRKIIDLHSARLGVVQ